MKTPKAKRRIARFKHTSRRQRATLMIALASSACTLLPMPSAQASGIPFATDRPQTWQFSSDFEGTYDSFGQNLEWNHDNRAFDSHGNQVAGPGTNTFVGLSTFIHYWKLQSLPHVGFNASITVPEVRTQGSQFSASGIGDPLIGGLVWYNPAPATTLGFQAYVQVPIGTNSVSTNTWSFWPSVFYDDWYGHVNVDLLVGGILRGRTLRTGQDDLSPGDTFHVNLRVGYSISPPDNPFAIPFIGVDHQTSGGTFNQTLGIPAPNTSSRETTVGAGVLFQFKPNSLPFLHQKMYDQLSIQYQHSVSGRNTTLTNGILVQAWHYW
ncbi:hypothetical protein AWB68_06418 [Caballeronia choica]|uniref:Uncharacterized protein n=1 Tax=Caballeronia choica TaxID=326476 RepID=A0A158KM77_9BURK|nr:transporter [Caballeronia choica]SAL82184.1 hypothetical protein AWB68_06418 [Caballeronia choica]